MSSIFSAFLDEPIAENIAQLKMSGYIKIRGLENWSGLRMSEDGPGGRILSLGAIPARLISGKTTRKNYEITPGVPFKEANVRCGFV